MIITKHPSTLLLLFLTTLVTLSFTITTSDAADCVGKGGVISVYWGQQNNESEGTLQQACATGLYNIVILESLIVYDNGSTPTLNLAGHCSFDHPCSQLQPQIEFCQKNNIKVFLSIGQDASAVMKDRYSNHYGSSSNGNLKKISSNTEEAAKKTRKLSFGEISSNTEEAAKKLANYLLENYLSGKTGPLGNVTLDGINIANVLEGKNIHWDELVKAINGSTTARKIYLSASPECVYPDYYLDKAIQTGLFDYIWVEFFYQNPCIYTNGNATSLLSAWKTWTSKVPNSLIFLGIVASNDTAGYIPPNDLKTKVLPTVKEAKNFGGVMIWDRYRDFGSNYTAQIKDGVGKVCRCVCDDGLTSSNFYNLLGSF